MKYLLLYINYYNSSTNTNKQYEINLLLYFANYCYCNIKIFTEFFFK